MAYLNGISFLMVQKSLDAVWLRQRVISNNIANADTPGYKSKSVDFEQQLQRAIKTTSLLMNTSKTSFQRRIDNIDIRINEEQSTATDETGNNVVLDKEQIELARAQMQYDYLVTSLNSELNRIKYAINGGR